MGSGSGSGTDSANPLWMIIWFLILIFLGFPVAGFCAGWYILIMPFTVCIEGLTVSDTSSSRIGHSGCMNSLSSRLDKCHKIIRAKLSFDN